MSTATGLKHAVLRGLDADQLLALWQDARDRGDIQLAKRALTELERLVNHERRHWRQEGPRDGPGRTLKSNSG